MFLLLAVVLGAEVLRLRGRFNAQSSIPEATRVAPQKGSAAAAASTDPGEQSMVQFDYALAVQSPEDGEQEYELLIPRGTRYPTAPDFGVRYYADAPEMTEMRFVLCEVRRSPATPVKWERRKNGNLYWAPQSADEQALATQLNPTELVLPLNPVGTGVSPRLRVAFVVNKEGSLAITVDDLVTRRTVRDGVPVARLH